MATTNFFFNNQSFAGEQKLLNDLSVEMIKIHGVDVLYMIRTTPNIDRLFLEDPTSEFDNAVEIEMYIKNFQGWQGAGDLMSKFGISMADQITFCVSRTRFSEDIGAPFSIIRPREGDLIYFPIPKAIFEVKFVEHEAVFYQTGALQVFELKCERFNYSDEKISVGIAEIDSVESKYTYAVDPTLLETEAEQLLKTEAEDFLATEERIPDLVDNTIQNQYFENEGLNIDFNATNPFNE